MSAEGLNRLVDDLRRPQLRDAMLSNPDEFLRLYDLTHEESESILDENWRGLVRLGATVDDLRTLGAAVGLTLHEVAQLCGVMNWDMFWALAAERQEQSPLFALLP